MTTSGNSAKGLEGVVAAETRLSDVQGEAGELIYCGYNIHELAGNVSYEEVVHLLHENRLPNAQELAALKKTLAAERHLPEPVVAMLRSFPKDTPPMHAIRTGISALGCFDREAEDTSPEAEKRKAYRLIAQIPVVTATFHRLRQGKAF